MISPDLIERMEKIMKLSSFGALLISSGLVVGALAAHALPPSADLKTQLGIANAVAIQLVHGAIFFCLGLRPISKFLTVAVLPISLGMLLFCVPVYVKAFGYVEHATFAPFGGGLLIVTWLALSLALFLNIPWKQQS